VTVTPDIDSAAAVRFAIGGAEWPLVEVRSASLAEVASVEIVAAYFTDHEAGTSSPAGARAVVRDAAGGLVWGAPVVWSLDEGLLALGDPQVTLPGADYVAIADSCVPPSENRGLHAAVLRATLGERSVTKDLDWRVAEGLTDEGWEASPNCVEGTPPEPTDTGEPAATDTGSAPTDEPPDAEPTPVADDPKCGCATASPGWLALLLPFVRRRTRIRPD
jgi:hypothetical protein